VQNGEGTGLEVRERTNK
jgi:hypothetical protein